MEHGIQIYDVIYDEQKVQFCATPKLCVKNGIVITVIVFTNNYNDDIEYCIMNKCLSDRQIEKLCKNFIETKIEG